jgi:hypothetical protein
LQISGDLKVGNNALSGSTTKLQLLGTGTQNITDNGTAIAVSMSLDVTINGAGGTFNLSATSGFTIGGLTLTNGTLALGASPMAVSSFALGSGTKTLDFGSGSLTTTGTWNANTNVSGFAVTPGTGRLVIDNQASLLTFSGGGLGTYPELRIGLPYTNIQSTAAVTIQQSNTFARFGINPGGSVKFQSGQTQTITDLGPLRGDGTGNVTIASTTSGSAATLSTTGRICSDYLTMRDNTITGVGSAHAGTHSTNTSNNTGWTFNASECSPDVHVFSGPTE